MEQRQVLKKLCTKNATSSPAKRDGKNDALLQTRQKLHCCQTIKDSKSIHDTPLLVLIYSPKSVHTFSFFLKLIIFVLPSRHFLISGHTTFAFHSCRETRTAVSKKRYGGLCVCIFLHARQKTTPAAHKSNRGIVFYSVSKPTERRRMNRASAEVTSPSLFTSAARICSSESVSRPTDARRARRASAAVICPSPSVSAVR